MKVPVQTSAPALLGPAPALGRAALEDGPDSDVDLGIGDAEGGEEVDAARADPVVTWSSLPLTLPIFYRVVKANPSRSKLAQAAPNVKQFKASHQIVQVYWQIKHTERWNSKREVLLSLDPVNTGGPDLQSFCFDVGRTDDDVVLADWCCWDVCAHHEFVLLDFLDLQRLPGQDLCELAPLDSLHESMEVIERMVNAQAFANTDSFYAIGSRGSSSLDDAQRAYLVNLKDRGFVTTMENEDDEPLLWQFTEAGGKRVRPCLVLKNKRSVSHARPRPADKHDWTLFEMISFLEGQSWTLVRERQRLSADRVLDLAMALRGGPCEDKHLFFDKTMSKNYLLALVHLEELQQVGVTQILHGQPASYYARFFDTKGLPRFPPVCDQLPDNVIMDLELELEEADRKIPPRPKRARRAQPDGAPLPPSSLQPEAATVEEAAPADSQTFIEPVSDDVIHLEMLLDDGFDAPLLGGAADVPEEANSQPREGLSSQDLPVPVGELGETVEENSIAAASSQRPEHRHPRAAASDVIGFWYDDPTTQLSHKFTFKSATTSWQVRCSYRNPKVNPSGSKTHCTRTLPVTDGDSEAALTKLKEWIAEAPDHPDKASHQALGHGKKRSHAAAAKPKPKARAGQANDGSAASSDSSSTSTSSSDSSSSSSSSSQ